MKRRIAHYVIHKGKDGPRWRAVGANGKVLCHGGQGFSRLRRAVGSILAMPGGKAARIYDAINGVWLQ